MRTPQFFRKWNYYSYLAQIWEAGLNGKTNYSKSLNTEEIHLGKSIKCFFKKKVFSQSNPQICLKFQHTHYPMNSIFVLSHSFWLHTLYILITKQAFPLFTLTSSSVCVFVYVCMKYIYKWMFNLINYLNTCCENSFMVRGTIAKDRLVWRGLKYSICHQKSLKSNEFSDTKWFR